MKFDRRISFGFLMYILSSFGLLMAFWKSPLSKEPIYNVKVLTVNEYVDTIDNSCVWVVEYLENKDYKTKVFFDEEPLKSFIEIK